MDVKIKARIMDAKKIKRVFQRITTEIIERNRNLNQLVIVGIRTRGVPIARRIQKLIKNLEEEDVPLGILDATLYRDDFSDLKKQHKIKKTEIGFDISDKDILLVDDVIFTGRTIRAAMDSLFDLGRPKSIQLLVFIDRGHRELPIQADYTGKFLPTSRRENVKVRLKELDDIDEVLITEPIEIQ
jgi:pyrimidine operon attenuation protein/uracil phosphoribosyltransferase